ncbi:MAG: 5-oxoprolinase subunit PxpA [Bacteroidia bacterium]|nr:5-oxoprolinase subunit PxpA [Bacteroidia bacterium]
MNRFAIDINADVGEGIGNESVIMPYLSSCNIACGGHAGDAETMQQVVKLAREHKVKIGAHPSFPDPEGFGRQPMSMPCAALYSSIKSQIKALMSVLREEHTQLHHIKPHGALYNMAAKDERTAIVILEAVKSIPLPLVLYVPYGSVISNLAKEENIRTTFEVFADRNYNDDLSLVSRSEADAIITDPDQMCAHVIRMISRGVVRTISGKEVPIQAETVCVHGDNPEAIQLIKNLREKLDEAGIKVR